MSQPTITHLQFAVLSILGHEEKTGRAIRCDLGGIGVKSSGPAFYQLMGRLEEGKLIEGRYDQRIVDGQIIKERAYWAKPSGQRAVHQTRAFYGALLNK